MQCHGTRATRIDVIFSKTNSIVLRKLLCRRTFCL